MTANDRGGTGSGSIEARAAEIALRQLDQGYRSIDGLFAVLLPLQWLAAVAVAWRVSPYTWAGESSWIHAHVWAAVFLGGVTVLPPLAMALIRPGREATRQAVAIAQMLIGALLIHLSGGRPEAHFHVFGSLAFLALYRDWRVLITASLVVVLDHYLRGVYWPRSIFGDWGTGPWRWVEHAAWVLFEDSVLIYGCSQKVRAIGKIARHEAEQEARQDWIEQAVAERTADLARANEMLQGEVAERRKAEAEAQAARAQSEAASRAKGEFLANMSHEIRTPMNGVLGMTELALHTELDPIQREYLEIVHTSAEAMLSVINDILDFSKIEAGKLDIDPVPFRLSALFDETLPMLASRAHAKGLELIYRIDPAVPDRVVGDSHRLRQVLINLVGNAIKFTAEGEVVVTVEPGGSAGDHQGAGKAGNVDLIFNVVDSGIGIFREKLGSIFEPFEQADGSTTRRYGGTGLGLTISSQLVNLMGGEIRVESEPGRGSRFWFNIPFEVLDGREASSGVPDPAALRGLAILVVDDNATTLRIIGETLNNWGALPTLVDGGEPAMRALREAAREGRPFDLALVDRLMPGINGIELAGQIRAEPGLSGLPMVMLTAAPPSDEQERRRELGISRCLSKPARLMELFKALSQAVADRDRPRPSAAEPDSPSGPRPASVGDEGGSRTLRILLVEDQLINQKVAGRMIERLGHGLAIADNGRSALEWLAREPFDLVLMDLQMPEMDGFEALDAIRLREQGQPTRLPVVALTAHALKGDEQRCLDRGFDDYLSKPIRSEQLEQVIGRQLARPAGTEPRAALTLAGS